MLPSARRLSAGPDGFALVDRAIPTLHLQGMDRSLFRYIFRHTWRDQVVPARADGISFPLIYINLELPKRIVNNAIQGKNIPATFLGFPVTQISYLMALSLLLLR